MTDSAENIALESPTITLASTIPIKPEDYDFLVLFLESRKQSGGGDIRQIRQIDPRRLTVVYESAEVAVRVLVQRFLTFKKYLLRSSVFEHATQPANYAKLMKQTFKLNPSGIIVRDLKTSDEVDDTSVRLYAEHLVPDDNNDVVAIQKTHLAPDTFFIVYKSNLNRDAVLQRHAKKPIIREKRIEIMDAFITHSLVVFAKTAKTQEFNALDVKNRIVSIIRNKIKTDNHTSLFYFVELTTNYILIEFNGKFDKQLIKELETTFEYENFAVEYIHNFELLKIFTENYASTKPLFEMSSMSIALPKTSVDQNKVSVKISATSSNMSVANSEASSYRTAQTSSLLSHSQATSSSPNVLNLDQYTPLSIALLNCHQVYANLNLLFKRRKKNLALHTLINPKTGHSYVSIEHGDGVEDQEWHDEARRILDEFFATELSYETIPIPASVLGDMATIDSCLMPMVKKLNESKTAPSSFFQILGDGSVHCYGVKKSVAQNAAALRQEISKMCGTNTNVTQDAAISPTSLSIKPDSILYLCLCNVEKIRVEFQSRVNARVIFNNSNRSIFIELSESHARIGHIKSVMDSFEKTRLVKVNINLTTAFNMTPAIVHEFRKLIEMSFQRPKAIYYEFNKVDGCDFILAYGYKESIDSFKIEAEKRYASLMHRLGQGTITVGNNTANSNRVTPPSKSCIKQNNIGKSNGSFLQFVNGDEIHLSESSHRLEFVVLSKLNEKYFNDISNDLKNKYSASIAKVDYFRIKCAPNSDYSRKSNLLNYVRQFFYKFARTVLTNVTKADMEQNQVNPQLVFTVWTDQNELELIGLRHEVGRLVQIFTSKSARIISKQPNINSQNANSSSSAAKVTQEKLGQQPAQETFLVNDLKWYQTRILFEKKYFQYIAESFKDLQVLLDKDLTRIAFSGRKTEINLAKDLAFDILKEILGGDVQTDDKFLKDLVSREHFYTNLIRKENLCCVIDAKSAADKFTIYATSVEEIQKCKDFLLQCQYLLI